MMRMWGLLSAALLASACTNNESTPVPPGEPFWLQDVNLLTTRKGREVRHVEGPLLVTVAADGWVESNGETLGFVDAQAPLVPGRGMILFAARTTALRDLTHRERVWGKLHPGARVAVRPAADGYEVAPGPPFGRRRFFVARHDLSVTPIQGAVGQRDGVFCEALRWRPEVGAPIAWTDPCLPIQLGAEPGRVRQELLGVELDGQVIKDDRARCGPGFSFRQPGCVAETVVKTDRGMRWEAAPLAVARPVDSLPAGHAPIERSTRLHRHFQRSNEVFVKRWGDGTVTCTAVAKSSRPDTPVLSLGLTHQVLTNPTGTANVSASIGSYGISWGYIEVGSGDDHVDLLEPELPPGARSYVMSDVERWYFTSAACEAAPAPGTRLHGGP